MSAFIVEQDAWSSGELDPKLVSRKDISHYYAAAERLRNVFVFPQGGFRRRDGLAFMARHPRQISEIELDVTGITVSAINGGTAANLIDGTYATVFTTNDIGAANPWGVFKVDLGSERQVMFIDLLQCSLSAEEASGPDDNTPYTFAMQIGESDSGPWKTVATVRVIDTTIRDWRLRIDETAQFFRLVKATDETFSTGTALTLKQIEFYAESTSEVSDARVIGFNFEDSQRYKIVLSDRNAAVFKDAELVADVRCPDLLHSMLAGLNWTQTLDTLLIFHTSHQTIKLLRGDYDEAWAETQLTYTNIPPLNWGDQDTSGITLTLSATSGVDVTVTAASGTPFTSDMVGWAIEYIPGAGYGRIISYTSSTVVHVRVLNTFATVNVEAGEWNLLEPAWSDTRGWPQCGAVGSSRLWVGGTAQRPNQLWASRGGAFFDFDNGGEEDDYGFSIVLDSDDVANIYDILISDHVQIFTSAGEFFLLPSNERITPLNADQRNPTKIGMKGPGLKVFTVEKATLFPQREGKAIREWLLAESVNETYTATNLSLLATHLIVDPVDVALRKATSTEEADIYAVVNNDGTFASFLTLRTEGINAWALQITNGTFLNVGTDKDELVVVVQRPDGDRYVEVFDDTHLLDSSVRYDVADLPGLTVSGLERFNTMTVAVVVDGLVKRQTVSDGEVTLEADPDEYVEIGLDFPNVNDIDDERDPRYGETFGVWVRGMPADVNPDTGVSLVGKLKRVHEAIIEVRETSGFYYGANNGPLREASFRRLGDDLLDQGLPKKTDTVKLQGLRGRTRTGIFDIVQKDPVSLEVIGVTRRLTV